jgi:hypothetical protein
MSDTENAWAAGFFDGEGCTFWHGPGHQLYLSISQKDTRALERFRDAVAPGRKLYGPYKRNYFTLTAGGKPAFKILMQLWPWLGDSKRQQALPVIERWQVEKKPEGLRIGGYS